MVLVTVEGLDGSGGTTLVDAISDTYSDCVLTSEPSDGKYGRLVRDNLSDEGTDSVVDFHLFMADRRDHIENVIRPADEDGSLVVSDRYADSTRAYQPVAMCDHGPFPTEYDAKKFIENVMSPWNLEPDLTIYLDVSVSTALSRAATTEKYENRKFLSRVKANYEQIIRENDDRFIRVDAEQSPEDVVDDAVSAIDQNI